MFSKNLIEWKPHYTKIGNANSTVNENNNHNHIEKTGHVMDLNNSKVLIYDSVNER